MNKLIKIVILILVLGFVLPCYAYKNLNISINNKISSLIENFRKNTNAPSAVLSIRFPNGERINYISGTTEKKAFKNLIPHKVTVDNLFQIGSITKSFIAVIILQLEAENKLSINDTIANMNHKYGMWLSKDEFNAWKNITIKQLLNMTSGIFSITEDPQFNEEYLVKFPKKQWDPKEELKFSLKHKNYFAPGTGWHYSDTDYTILGILIEAITGHSVETEINNRILHPTHLKNTYYLSRSYPDFIRKKMAHGYAYTGDFSPPVQPGTDMTFVNMSVANAAGAMVSNTNDIIDWVHDIFTGKILQPAQRNEMQSVVCSATDGSCKPGESLRLNSRFVGFGLGLVYLYHPKLGPIWFYIGSTAGYYAAFLWVPQQDLTLAMTISSSSEHSKKIFKTLLETASLVIKS